MLKNLQLAKIDNKWLRRLVIVSVITIVAILIPIMFLISLGIFLIESIREDFPYYWNEFVFHSTDLIDTVKDGIKTYWK